MADAFYGEVRIFGFNFAPMNWAVCDGSTLPIAQFQGLFAVIGNQYGGDGASNFKLPNLQGNAVMHSAPTASGNLTPRPPASTAGSQTVTLTPSMMPSHDHTVQGAGGVAATAQTNVAGTDGNSMLGRVGQGNTGVKSYGATPNTNLWPGMAQAFGGSQAHDNRQPYLPMNFCICLYGDFPVRAN